MSWMQGPFYTFDTETDAPEPTEAHLVTAAAVRIDGRQTHPVSWVAKPRRPIPDAAAGVHGYSTDRAEAEGRPSLEVVTELAALLLDAWKSGRPTLAFNAQFDLTVLDRELLRHDLPGLVEQAGGLDKIGPIIDPYTIDRELDRYRKGKRTLSAQCEEYGVELPPDQAHGAEADAMATARLMWKIGRRWPDVVEKDPWELHRAQVTWYRDRQLSFQSYLRGRGEDEKAATVTTEWPLQLELAL